MEIAMQIHHLDDNEADEIMSILSRKSLPSKWLIQRPTDETNSVLVRYLRNEFLESEVTMREILFDNATELLLSLEKNQIDEIKAFDSVGQIRSIPVMYEELFEKIAPYLEVK